MLELLQRLGEMGAGKMEDDRGIDIENECEADKRNIGGRLVLMLMRAGIFVGEVVVAVVGVMVAVTAGVMF